MAFTFLLVDHAEKLHEVPDEYLADALPLLKKIAIAHGAENYNVLQVRAVCIRSTTPSLTICDPGPGKNNGRIAHQVR